jgi:hypothetical protein
MRKLLGHYPSGWDGFVARLRDSSLNFVNPVLRHSPRRGSWRSESQGLSLSSALKRWVMIQEPLFKCARKEYDGHSSQTSLPSVPCSEGCSVMECSMSLDGRIMDPLMTLGYALCPEMHFVHRPS